MFFIRCGSLIAWALVVMGVLRTAMGFFVAFSTSDLEMPVAAARYLGTTNSGQAINDGMMLFAGGIVMGLLVQIAKGVKID